jgi:hypothetical protein
MADVQILEAYTITADGVRHDVQPTRNFRLIYDLPADKPLPPTPAVSQREESIEAELRSASLRGTATLTTSDLTAADGPLTITMKGTLESLVVPGAARY